MKAFKFIILCVVLIFSLSWIGIWDVEASTLWPRLREGLCWEYLKNDVPLGIAELKATRKVGDETFKLWFKMPLGTAKVGTTRIIGNSHLLSGTLNTSDGKMHSIHGNAEIGRENILITLVGSGKDDTATWTWTTHVTLDTYMLHGTWESIYHVQNFNLPVETDYASGSLNFIPCP